ncbi:autotransporter beta-domain protein, partial [Chlamydia psittaci 09DC78]
IHLS